MRYTYDLGLSPRSAVTVAISGVFPMICRGKLAVESGDIKSARTCISVPEFEEPSLSRLLSLPSFERLTAFGSLFSEAREFCTTPICLRRCALLPGSGLNIDPPIKVRVLLAEFGSESKELRAFFQFLYSEYTQACEIALHRSHPFL